MQRINWIILKSKDRGTDYGVGTFIKQLSEELAKQKHVSVFIMEIGLTQSQMFSIKQQDGITIVEFPLAENKTGTDTKKNQEKLSRNIARVVAQYLPGGNKNIIHMNYLFQYFVANALKEIVSGKIIFTQHFFVMRQQLAGNYYDIESEVYKSVDKIVTVTRHGKEHMIKKGASYDRIEVIYNGIDPNCFKVNPCDEIMRKYGLPQNEKLILYSGRLDPIKGLKYLCLAMEELIKKIPKCRLVVAGGGDIKLLIKSAAKFSANIIYLGFIPFEDVIALYHKVDIGVIPSREEHCSYVALEMLHCGLPVVASKVGGLKEIFFHGENALLVNTAEKTNLHGIYTPKVKELENFMYKILTDRYLRNKISQSAIIRANDLFTSKIMTDRYLKTAEEIYQEYVQE